MLKNLRHTVAGSHKNLYLNPKVCGVTAFLATFACFGLLLSFGVQVKLFVGTVSARGVVDCEVIQRITQPEPTMNHDSRVPDRNVLP